MALNAWNNFSGRKSQFRVNWGKQFRVRGCKWSLTHRTQHHSNIVKKKETTCKLFCVFCFSCCLRWSFFSGRKAVPGKLRARGCKMIPYPSHATSQQHPWKKKETTCKLFCVFCFSCCLRWSFWRSQQYQAKQLLGSYCCLKTLSINFSGKAVPGNPITDNADHGKPRTTNPFFSNILLEWKAASNWYLP